jgi:hypothetical protein
MNAKFAGRGKIASCAKRMLALGLVLAGSTASAALAEIAMPEQKRACTRDV